MKLERITEYLTVVVVGLVGALLALYCGSLSGQGQGIKSVAILGGLIAVLFAIAIRNRIWILIPLCWSMTGKSLGIPVRDGVIVYAFLIFLVLKALKVVRGKLAYGWVDVLLGANLVYMATRYINNPVGVDAFGSDMVAGRPYLEIIFAMLGYWVLGHVTISAKTAKRLPFYTVAANLSISVLSVITANFPSTAPFISKLYTGIDVSAYEAGENLNQETQRQGYLAPLSGGVLQILCAYFKPITLFNPLNFGRFLVLLTSIVFSFKSGHRISVIGLVSIIVVSAFFRSGIKEVFKIGLICVPILTGLIVFQGILFDLPIPAQRALSFLPGKWNIAAVEDAHGSSEWRFEMWRYIWNSDKYIKNRVWGDGFGITKKQLTEGAIAESLGVDSSAGRENLMVVGDYHSGPLTTIKFVGYVGGAMLLVLMLGVTVFAWQVIMKTKGTPFFPMALFFCVNEITRPIGYIFIFGDCKSILPDMLFTVSMLNLITRSLLAWRAEQQNQQMEARKIDRSQPFPEPVSAWPRRPALSLKS